MRLVQHELGGAPGNGSLFLLPLGDLHIGHPKHSKKTARQFVDWIAAAPNRYTILCGDMCEMALRDSYGEIYDQPLSPQKQAEAVVELLSPIKDRILGAVSGNHEQRVTQRTSIDPAMLYASALGVPYDPASMVLAVKWEGARTAGPNSHGGGLAWYTLYFTHGWGAARTLGPRLSQPMKLRDVVSNADVYITAHLHQPGEFPLDQFEIDLRHKQIVRKTQRFVTLGSTLDHAEYAEMKGLPPTTMDFPVIEFRPPYNSNGKDKKVVVHSSADRQIAA